MSARLRLGTSSWSSKDWIGPFYPPGTKASDFLSVYAKSFDAVEADTTYYGVPSRDMVFGWRKRTPEGFTLAAKFPRSVCHGGDGAKPDPEKVLDLEATARDRDAFLSAMFCLADRGGPLLLQFPYFNKAVFSTKKPFLERLDRYLSALPPDFRYAVEIRNKSWIGPDLLDLLRRHSAAFVLADQAWMPHGDEIPARLDPVTADFTYIRLLGDRMKIEAITKTWDREVIDHGERLARWAEVIRRLAPRVKEVFVFANNHYAGHAPSTIRRLRSLLEAPPPPPD